jgi:hypothetical protein
MVGFFDNPIIAASRRRRLRLADRLGQLLHDLAQALLAYSPAPSGAINAEIFLVYFFGRPVRCEVVVANGGWVYRAQTLVVFWERARVAGCDPAPEVVTGAGGIDIGLRWSRRERRLPPPRSRDPYCRRTAASAPEGAVAATSMSRNSGRASHVPQAEVSANRRTFQQAAGA